MRRIEFYRHSLGGDEAAEIAATLEGVFLTAGPRTRQFEQWLAGHLGVKGTVGVFSCTTALFLALKSLGIGEGDEVITTPMTFIATSNTVLHAGARVVFVDCDATSGVIDPDRVEAAITPRTKAILPVHLYGHMADMRRLRRIADGHGLKIIEDAAHCLEGERDGVRPGVLGDAACFSFYATKNMTAGEGGAVAANDPALLEHLTRLRSHGMDKEAAARHSGAYRHWDMMELGYKGNMFDIQAALLLPQVSKLDANWQRREQICRRYESACNDIGIDYPRVVPGVKSARHLFTAWVPPQVRDDVLGGLQQRQIGVAVNYRAVHLLSYYRQTFGYREGMFPNAERIGASTITLPLYPRMTDDDVEVVMGALRETVQARTAQVP